MQGQFFKKTTFIYDHFWSSIYFMGILEIYILFGTI